MIDDTYYCKVVSRRRVRIDDPRTYCTADSSDDDIGGKLLKTGTGGGTADGADFDD